LFLDHLSDNSVTFCHLSFQVLFNAVSVCHFAQKSPVFHLLITQVFHISLPIQLNSQAVSADNVQVVKYSLILDSSHSVRSSNHWKTNHSQNASHAVNNHFAAVGNLVAVDIAVAHHIHNGAVNATSVATSHKSSHNQYAHISSDNIHLCRKSLELACLAASFQEYHSACFILSRTVHSDTSAHNHLATEYHNSHSQAHILLQTNSAALHIVF
jgi:hypothetical protein